MRDINYRRKQEAKHYKKRLNIAVAIGRFSNKENDYQPKYAGKNRRWRINSDTPLNDYEKNIIEKQKNKRWKFQFKNDSLGGTIDSWSKRYCRRIRRHFQKLVDYKLPDKKWMVRDEALPRIISTLNTYNYE